MSRTNFYISVDRDGKCPVLTHDKPCREHWTKYIDNHPVNWNLPSSEDRIWSYRDSCMYGLHENVLSYADQKPLPVIHKDKRYAR